MSRLLRTVSLPSPGLGTRRTPMCPTAAQLDYSTASRLVTQMSDRSHQTPPGMQTRRPRLPSLRQRWQRPLWSCSADRPAPANQEPMRRPSATPLRPLRTSASTFRCCHGERALSNRVGSIFEALTEHSQELQCSLRVLRRHALHFGSYATSEVTCGDLRCRSQEAGVRVRASDTLLSTADLTSKR